jgi:ribosomal-protein-alanine N-acetyltransferase
MVYDKINRTIITERLHLRPFTLDDLVSTNEYAGDSENTKFMSTLPYKTINQTEKFIINAIMEWENETPQYYEFAVMFGDKHIGAVFLYDINEYEDGMCGIGWIIRNEYQGKGYATEAAKALSDFAFNILKIRKLVSHCDNRNEASISIMIKIGLSFDCDNGERYYEKNGEKARELMYSLVR